MAEPRGLGDVGARAQEALDERRGDGLAARRHDEVAGAIDELEPAVAPLAHIAGLEPAVGHDRARRGRVLPVALEQIVAAHQYLAVVGKLDAPAVDDGADVAGPR